jgi:CspA family cold shock protein
MGQEQGIGREPTQHDRKGIGLPTGTVKWFSNEKGYGFIAPDGGGNDVFVHQTAIKMNGFRTLEEGQHVEFEITTTDKGAQAQDVRPV